MASRTLSGTRFQIFWTMAFSSRLQVSMGPSILILREVRMTAKRVAVKVTVPSGLRGMFMATNRCKIVTMHKSGLDVKLLGGVQGTGKEEWVNRETGSSNVRF